MIKNDCALFWTPLFTLAYYINTLFLSELSFLFTGKWVSVQKMLYFKGYNRFLKRGPEFSEKHSQKVGRERVIVTEQQVIDIFRNRRHIWTTLAEWITPVHLLLPFQRPVKCTNSSWSQPHIPSIQFEQRLNNDIDMHQCCC